MRRSTIRWGFGVAVVVSVSGCASLLGDFTTSGESSGDDGGTNPDGSPNTVDGAVNGDDGGPTADSANDVTAPLDGPVADANEAGAVVPLSCVEQAGGVRRKIGSVAKSASNDGSRVQLFNTGNGNQSGYRAYVPESPSSGPTIHHIYSFNQGNGGNVTDTPIPVSNNNGQTLDVVRYATGIAALVFGNLNDGGISTPVLQVLKLEDAVNVWAPPVTLTVLSASCVNRIEGTLLVKNAASNDYFVEFAYQNGCGTTTTITHQTEHFVAGSGSPGFWQLPPQNVEVPDGGDAGPPADAGGNITFQLQGLAAAGTGLYAMTSPQGNGGPNPGIGVALYTSTTANTGASAYEVPLLDDSDIMQGLSIQSLASTNDIGLAILEADLSSQTVTPVVYAGHVPGSKLATLNPSTDLRATTLASISDLPINNSTYHWESFTSPLASDNLLGVGSIFPNNNGLNFLWWNGEGAVRAQRTNTTGFFYFDPSTTGLAIYGGDVTFTSAPFAAIAGFELVFIQSDSEASTVNDIWATQINCAPK